MKVNCNTCQREHRLKDFFNPQINQAYQPDFECCGTYLQVPYKFSLVIDNIGDIKGMLYNTYLYGIGHINIVELVKIIQQLYYHDDAVSVTFGD